MKSDPVTPYPKMRAFPAQHFGWNEVACKHCGAFPHRPVLESEPFEIFCTVMDAIRGCIGKPVIVTSWYRCPHHPVEARKRHPGVHSYGIAADVLVNRTKVLEAIDAVQYCLRHVHGHAPMEVCGFGFAQKGDMRTRYVHVDIAGILPEFRPFRGAVWTY